MLSTISLPIHPKSVHTYNLWDIFYAVILFLVCLSDGVPHRRSFVCSMKKKALQIQLMGIPPARSCHKSTYGIRMLVTYLRQA